MKFKRYQLYVQIDDRWQWLASFDATDHAHAFSQAMVALKPEHYTVPIRLEQLADPTPAVRRSKRRK